MKPTNKTSDPQARTALGLIGLDPHKRVVDMTAGELMEIVDSRLEAFVSKPATSNDGALDRAGAAKFLGVSVPQIDKLCREKALPFHRVGDVKRFFRDELVAHVKGARS